MSNTENETTNEVEALRLENEKLREVCGKLQLEIESNSEELSKRNKECRDLKRDLDHYKSSPLIKFISEINNFIINHSNKIVTFRGEIKDYGQNRCCPNLFRSKQYKQNEGFEKNILDIMSANNIANDEEYLLRAINAQHDGFPSRLLDVSYNALVALHFAINPHYTHFNNEELSKFDKEDGKVYIFCFNEMFCATSDYIQNCYLSQLKLKDEYQNYIFSQNYKLIDHIKLNDRIVAQTGAFILYQGTEFHPIPEWMFKTITIKAEDKKRIREELKKIFGIDNSTMYPEIYNQVDNITSKGKMIKEYNHNIAKELEYFFDFFAEQCKSIYRNVLYKDNLDSKIEIIRHFEKEIFIYKEHLNSYLLEFKDKVSVSDCENKFNDIICDFDNEIKNLGIDIELLEKSF